MSMIVAKRAISAAGYLPAYKRARLAYQVAGMAYRNRKKIYRAARTIGRSYRRYRARKKIMFKPQNAPKTSTSKQRQLINVANQGFNTRTLYDLRLDEVLTGTERDERERNQVYYKGFKICFEARNNLDSVPLYVNMAVIEPVNSSAVVTSNFFRSQGTTGRGADFGTTRTALELRCLPINTDRYRVLLHKRFKLATNGGDSHHGMTSSFMLYERYLKYRTKLPYGGTLSTSVGAVPWLVYWCDESFNPSLAPVSVGAGTYSLRVISYFRDGNK